MERTADPSSSQSLNLQFVSTADFPDFQSKTAIRFDNFAPSRFDLIDFLGPTGGQTPLGQQQLLDGFVSQKVNYETVRYHAPASKVISHPKSRSIVLPDLSKPIPFSAAQRYFDSLDHGRRDGCRAEMGIEPNGRMPEKIEEAS